jgi:hypothetical protein
VFVRAVIGSRREAGGHFHTSSENLMTRFARGCFVITSCRLARRTTPQRYCGYHTFEHNGVAGKGYGVAGFDPVRGLHTLAVEVDSAMPVVGVADGAQLVKTQATPSKWLSCKTLQSVSPCGSDARRYGRQTYRIFAIKLVATPRYH